MGDMNAGIETFVPEKSWSSKYLASTLEPTLWKSIVSRLKKIFAVWIPTYGYNDGYYNAAPNTRQPYMTTSNTLRR